MKMSEAKKGLRVCLTPEAYRRNDSPLIQRHFGTLTSGRVVALKRPYEEGLVCRVKWDGLTTPENWHLTDLRIANVEAPDAD